MRGRVHEIDRVDAASALLDDEPRGADPLPLRAHRSVEGEQSKSHCHLPGGRRPDTARRAPMLGGTRAVVNAVSVRTAVVEVRGAVVARRLRPAR